MVSKKSIYKKILAYNSLLIVIFALMIIFLFLKLIYTEYLFLSEKNKENLISERKFTLKKSVDDILESVILQNAAIKSEIENNLKDTTYFAYDKISELYFYNKETDSSKTNSTINDFFKQNTISKPEYNYFCISMDGTALSLSSSPDLEGTNILNLRGLNNKYIIKDLISYVKGKKEGFFHFEWKTPSADNFDCCKIAYVKYFEPLDIIIGTDTYTHDFESNLKKDVLNKISGKSSNLNIRVIDSKKFIVKITNSAISYTPINENGDYKILEKTIAGSKEFDNTYNTYYTNRNSEKYLLLSYVKSFPEWNWIFYADVSLNDIEIILNEKNSILKKQYISKAAKVLSIIILLTLLILYIQIHLLNHILSKYKMLSAALRDNEYIHEDSFKYKEVESLACDINKILRERKEKDLLGIEKKYSNEIFDKHKRYFLENLTNELRVELNSIISMSTVLLETQLEQKQINTSQSIKNASENLLDIINDIIALSSTDNESTFILQEISFNPSILLEEIKNRYVSFSKNPNIPLYISLEPNLPKKVIGDFNKIRQVLYALTGIVLKSMSNGNITLSLSAPEKSISNTSLLFTVKYSDISNESINSHVSFYENIESNINISIAKKVLNILKSKLSFVESNHNNIEFFFSISLKNDTSLDNISSSKIKVSKDIVCLIADDNEINMSALSFLIEKSGIKVIQSKDGKDALEKFKSTNIDIVIMDIQMPEMDGIESTRQIRLLQKESGINAHAPVIAITAYHMEEDNDIYKELLFDDLIEKPYKKERLDKMLKKFLKR